MTDSNSLFMKKFIAMAIGNFMEWFDFSVFGALVDIISAHFFPAEEGSAISFIKTIAIFGVGFLMRPLGGLLIGRIGDKFGRKVALEISILLMLLPSFLIGCLPTYDQIGWLAPILLLILRMVQGLAAGGELVGALIFTLESTEGKHTGFWGGACKATGNFGSTIGLGVAALLRHSLTEKDMHSWGWRVPFWLGILFGALGIMSRKSLTLADSHGEELNRTSETYSSYLKRLLREHLSDIIIVIFVAAFWGCTYYTGFIWMAYYLHDPMLIGGDKGIQDSWTIVFIANVLIVIGLPLGGYMGDMLTPFVQTPGKATKTVLQLAIFAMVAVVLPAFMLIRTKEIVLVSLGMVLLAVPVSLFGGNLPIYMITHFSRSLRFSGVGLAYNMAHALFSSTVSIIQTSLIVFLAKAVPPHHEQGIVDNPHLFPVYYILLISAISYITLQCDNSYPYPLLKEEVEYVEVETVLVSAPPPPVSKEYVHVRTLPY